MNITTSAFRASRCGHSIGYAKQYITLQHTATHCNIMQYNAIHCYATYQTATWLHHKLHLTATHFITLHHTTITLHHTASHCSSAPQHTVINCNNAGLITLKRGELPCLDYVEILAVKGGILTGGLLTVLVLPGLTTVQLQFFQLGSSGCPSKYQEGLCFRVQYSDTVTLFNIRQHTTTYYYTLHHIATHCHKCSVLQHSAARCNTL